MAADMGHRTEAAVTTPKDESEVEDYDDLDADTRAAIEEAEAQFARGEGISWEVVRERLRAKFIKE